MADDGNTCLFIDVQVSVGNRNIYATKLLLQSEEDLYADAVEEVLAEYAATVADDAAFVEGSDDDVDPIKVATQTLLGRIKSVKCAGKPTELYKFLQRSGITLKMLNSAATPIFKSGIAINLAPKEVRVPPAKDAPNLLNPLDILMGKGEPEHVKFLSPSPDEPKPRMDAQIKARVVELLSEDIKLGYFSITQRACLAKNAGTLVSVLCCVQKHWKKLLRKDFPNVPVGDKSNSLLLELVAKCHRARPSNDRLTLGVLSTHCGALSGLDWSPYKHSKRLKCTLGSFKREIEMIRGILMAKKQDMVADNTAPTDPVNRAPSVFESLPSYVKLDSDTDEFFASIGRSVGTDKKKPRGRTTAKSRSVNKALKDLAELLRTKEDYVPIFLKDEDMGDA